MIYLVAFGICALLASTWLALEIWPLPTMIILTAVFMVADALLVGFLVTVAIF
jgi:hypothetical protein